MTRRSGRTSRSTTRQLQLDVSEKRRSDAELRWRTSFGFVTHVPSNEWSDWDGEGSADPIAHVVPILGEATLPED